MAQALLNVVSSNPLERTMTQMGIRNTTATWCSAALLFASVGACSAADGSTGDPPPAQILKGAEVDDDDTADTADAAPKKSDPAKPELACPSVFPETPACQSCFAKSCKAECGTCGADEDCKAALECLGPCTTSSCISACVSGLSSASTALLGEVLGKTGCVSTQCADECGSGAPAANKKTGDACSADAECISGSCNTWCADSCTHNTDCGVNTSGKLVWCVATQASTDSCFPGCKSNSDCSIYPGSTCKAVTATNGSTTTVCSF